MTTKMRAELEQFGRITSQLPNINAVFLAGSPSAIPAIQSLPYVKAANLDARREIGPIAPLPVGDFTETGLNTWDLDAVGVTDCPPLVLARPASFCSDFLDVAISPGTDPIDKRVVSETGRGVIVAILDTGLAKSWPFYFPADRIATQYAKSFGGGGAAGVHVSEQPNKWERDISTHGTHVTSSVIGYNFNGIFINGTAPEATIIPVKVLNQNGSGHSSVIAAGIDYIADLVETGSISTPVVINMSLGGPVLDAVEKAAIDRAIGLGIVIVASAGNNAEDGMGFPGAYTPVISVGAIGWVNEWKDNNSDGSPNNWWLWDDVTDPTDTDDFYVTGFSSRELMGQDLDVLAPGSWIVGPFQLQQGTPSYFFVGGTSQAAPHVSGLAALLLQNNPSLNSDDGDPTMDLEGPLETVLQAAAIPLPAGSRMVLPAPGAPPQMISWGNDANGSGIITAGGLGL
jgi:subtilisin family serine protease